MYVYWQKSASCSFAAVNEYCQVSVIPCWMTDWGKLEGDRILHEGCCKDCMLTKNKLWLLQDQSQATSYSIHMQIMRKRFQFWIWFSLTHKGKLGSQCSVLSLNSGLTVNWWLPIQKLSTFSSLKEFTFEWSFALKILLCLKHIVAHPKIPYKSWSHIMYPIS